MKYLAVNIIIGFVAFSIAVGLGYGTTSYYTQNLQQKYYVYQFAVNTMAFPMPKDFRARLVEATTATEAKSVGSSGNISDKQYQFDHNDNVFRLNVIVSSKSERHFQKPKFILKAIEDFRGYAIEVLEEKRKICERWFQAKAVFNGMMSEHALNELLSCSTIQHSRAVAKLNSPDSPLYFVKEYPAFRSFGSILIVSSVLWLGVLFFLVFLGARLRAVLHQSKIER